MHAKFSISGFEADKTILKKLIHLENLARFAYLRSNFKTS